MAKVIKGNFIYTSEKDAFDVKVNHYMVIEDGKVLSLTDTLPEAYQNEDVEVLEKGFLIPGFVDLHVHAPQYPNMGIGYSEELLNWLDGYTFPLESAYSDLEFAKKNYSAFIADLKRVGTTRASIFATRHLEATKLLFALMKGSGLGAYIGKVNMDRGCEKPLLENTQDSIRETTALLEEELAYARRMQENGESPLVQYILTPRFVPSTTPELMEALGELIEKYDLPMQSHLDENRGEIALVKELHPDIPSFAEVYEHYGLLSQDKTIMAHCIHMTDDEIALLKKRGVTIAHCPDSNNNVMSGIMPLRRIMEEGIKVGLGSDVGGGHTLDMRHHIVLAMQMSKIFEVYNPDYKGLSTSEAFYLATKGGGQFFGKVGSFEEGYEFDALWIDDTSLPRPLNANFADRLEKFIYTGTPELIKKRFVSGCEI